MSFELTLFSSIVRPSAASASKLTPAVCTCGSAAPFDAATTTAPEIPAVCRTRTFGAIRSTIVTRSGSWQRRVGDKEVGYDGAPLPRAARADPVVVAAAALAAALVVVVVVFVLLLLLLGGGALSRSAAAAAECGLVVDLHLHRFVGCSGRVAVLAWALQTGPCLVGSS